MFIVLVGVLEAMHPFIHNFLCCPMNYISVHFFLPFICNIKNIVKNTINKLLEFQQKITEHFYNEPEKSHKCRYEFPLKKLPRLLLRSEHMNGGR